MTDTLTASETDTMELLRQYHETGNEELKWQIALRYEYLVKAVAMQVRGIYSSFAQMEDIINEGLLTLLKSIDKFDPRWVLNLRLSFPSGFGAW